MRRIRLLWLVLAIPRDVPLKCLMARHRLLISEVTTDLGCVHVQVLIKIQAAGQIWRRALFINNSDSPVPPGNRGQLSNPALQVEPVCFPNVIHFTCCPLILNGESDGFRHVRHVAPRSTPSRGPLVQKDGLSAIVHSLQIGPEASLLAIIRAAGLQPEVLERGRNARTSAEASQVSLILARR